MDRSVLSIKIKNTTIYETSKVRFLGLFLSSNLNWQHQISHVWKTCQCLLKILSCLRHTWWGADPRLLRIICIALVRSRLDYGSFILHGITKTQKIKLDRIQFKALKIVLGLRMSTPSNFVLAESKEPSLTLRADFLCKNWMTRVISQSDHLIIPIFTEL